MTSCRLLKADKLLLVCWSVIVFLNLHTNTSHVAIMTVSGFFPPASERASEQASARAVQALQEEEVVVAFCCLPHIHHTAAALLLSLDVTASL